MKTKKKAKRAYRWHDHEKFIRIWQKAASLSEVSEKYGISRESASTTAHNIRGRGVKLKDMRSMRFSSTRDYKRLAKLATTISGSSSLRGPARRTSQAQETA